MDDILRQQLDYYRARAVEYDEWFYRRGRYDYGEAINRQWFEQAATVREALHALGPVGSALELACGTGIWTQELVKMADRVTALDGSPEMIAINRAKVGDPRVTYREADLFAWRPEEPFDLVFFGFWLSHVPPERLDGFLRAVFDAVKPGGRLFLVDSMAEKTSSAHDHTPPDAGEIVHDRKLNDGREFRVVKIFYDPPALQARLNALGLAAEIRSTGYFLVGQALKPG